MLCLSGCGQQSAPGIFLPLRVHSLPRCDLPQELVGGNLELLALGDFAASNESAEVLPLDRPGATLKFPLATQAVEARVGEGVSGFTGYGERRRDGGLDVLLWPDFSTCVVSRPDGAEGYPGEHGGQALGFSASRGTVFAAGGNDPLVSDAIVGALSFDVATGRVTSLDASTDGVLQQPRAFATVTTFDANFLVAGGEQPVFGVPDSDIVPQASAEVFDAESGKFSDELIALHSSRTHHAAVTLADGRTLLVGGRTQVGRTSIAQYQLELVDPQSKRASVGEAIAPRIDPGALVLSDARVFVGGGTGLDGALAAPVAQWLTRDAQLDDTMLSPDVAPRFDRAFVATVGGGVLAVGGCEDRPAESDDDAKTCTRFCAHGCPPLDEQGVAYDAWWIASDGTASPVSLDGISAPRPILLPGTDGRPWLVAADASAPDDPQLFRFNPWSHGPKGEPTAAFEPTSMPSTVRLPRPGMPQPLSLGSDAFAWVDDEGAHGELLGLRLGTRSRFSQDVALVLSSDPVDPNRPLHLTPEHARGAGASYDGQLTLRGAALRARLDPPDLDPDVTVWIADTDYADATFKLHVASEALPLVVLGETELGGADCPWPDGDDSGGDFDLPTVVRSGARVELRWHGAGTSCRVEPSRLTFGLRAGEGEAVVTQLEVERGTPTR